MKNLLARSVKERAMPLWQSGKGIPWKKENLKPSETSSRIEHVGAPPIVVA